MKGLHHGSKTTLLHPPISCLSLPCPQSSEPPRASSRSLRRDSPSSWHTWCGSSRHMLQGGAVLVCVSFVSMRGFTVCPLYVHVCVHSQYICVCVCSTCFAACVCVCVYSFAPSHFDCCLKMPCIICPHMSQKVGPRNVYFLKRWGTSILNLSFKYYSIWECIFLKGGRVGIW